MSFAIFYRHFEGDIWLSRELRNGEGKMRKYRILIALLAAVTCVSACDKKEVQKAENYPIESNKDDTKEAELEEAESKKEKVPDVMDYLEDLEGLMSVLKIEKLEESEETGFLRAKKENLDIMFEGTDVEDSFLFAIKNAGYANVSLGGLTIGMDYQEAMNNLEAASCVRDTIYYDDEYKIPNTNLSGLVYDAKKGDQYYQIEFGYEPLSGAVEYWTVFPITDGLTPKAYALGNDSIGWKKKYIEYIDQENKKYPDEPEYWGYQLINIDGDNVPELYISLPNRTDGARICSFHEGIVISQWLYNFGFSYIEGENLFMNFEGYMDEYYDMIYTIKNGEFVVLHEGEFGAEDNANVQWNSEGPIYQYFWDGTQVSSEEEYNQLLNQVYDTKKSINPYDGEGNGMYSVDAYDDEGNGMYSIDEIEEEILKY